MEITNIDPDGDVVLVCGEQGKQQGLRVCSKALSRASPVFKALLSPKFKEGATLRSGGAVEIPLPDDDPELLKSVCYGLHLCHDQIDFGPTLDTLVRITKLADKYDLGRALRPIAEVWITKRLGVKSEREYPTLMGVAYLLRHEQMFNKVGELLLWQCTTRILKTEVEGLETTLRGVPPFSPVTDLLGEFSWPEHLATSLTDEGALSVQRVEAIASMAQDVENVLVETVQLRDDHCRHGEPGSVQGCLFVEKRLLFTINQFRSKSLWPTHELHSHSLAFILESMADCGFRDGY